MIFQKMCMYQAQLREDCVIEIGVLDGMERSKDLFALKINVKYIKLLQDHRTE